MTSVARADDRPNIILLLADDQCKYSMGCYDTPAVKTPNLDRLASRGVVFDRAYATTAICMASRATLVTGKYEYKTGCNFESGPLSQADWQASYPMLLKDAGYNIGFAGKFGFLVAEQPGQKGELPEADFDAWGGGPGQTSYETARNVSMHRYAEEFPHSTLSYGAFGRDFIARAAGSDEPFCLSISFKAPHHPTTPDPRFDSVYDGVVFQKPKNFGRQYGEHLSLQSRGGRQYDRHHSWHYADDYQNVMAIYYQQIYAIDQALGMIADALERSGTLDNTVIIYTSDNGFMCGSHGYGSKVLPYEESSCVPLIVTSPAHSQNHGQRCDALVGNIDLAPTILDLAGIKVPSECDGQSLTHLLENPERPHHTALSLINVWGPSAVHSLAVVTPEHKLIYWPANSADFSPTVEVFDMQRDRLELSDLTGRGDDLSSFSGLVKEYNQRLSNWQQHGVQRHNYPAFAEKFELGEALTHEP